MSFLSVIPIVGKVLDRVLPDDQAKAEAKLKLMELEGSQEIDEINAQLSAIIAEANSRDKWTSRARPTFLYVFYTLILASIPMGILNAFNPELAEELTLGMGTFLSSIPEIYVEIFCVGYLGYTGARSIDKRKVK